MIYIQSRKRKEILKSVAKELCKNKKASLKIKLAFSINLNCQSIVESL